MAKANGASDSTVAGKGKWQITWRLETGYLLAVWGIQAAEA